MIVSIVSSPRKDGYGVAITSAAVEAARANGNEVREFFLNDMVSYHQCQNCEACKESGSCILDDDISPIIDVIREADGMILCTSIAFNDYNGLFKMLLDRFYCFLDMNASTILPKGKKVGIIVTASMDPETSDCVGYTVRS